MKQKINHTLMGLLAIASLLALDVNESLAANNPGVLKTSEKQYYGKTYGEWVVSYWQWAMSIPIASNPWANDPDGRFAANGQSGPVWFLGGSLGDSVTRSITIPGDKAIFVPVHQWIFGAIAFDCDPSNPGVPCDEQSLRKAAAAATKAVDSMEVLIDGASVNDLGDYRVKSPSTFSVTVPDDNLSSVPAGTYSPQVADGYYLLLSPLSAGSHTIFVHVISTLGYEYQNVYNLTISP
jgi:hypothetical protein